MPRIWGRWIVGFATMLMFVAIITGVITHKKIFTDFFTFRPRKGQRSWLDAHNATAVLALPDRKSTRLNSSHLVISYAVFCLKKKNTQTTRNHECSQHAVLASALLHRLMLAHRRAFRFCR